VLRLQNLCGNKRRLSVTGFNAKLAELPTKNLSCAGWGGSYVTSCQVPRHSRRPARQHRHMDSLKIGIGSENTCLYDSRYIAYAENCFCRGHHPPSGTLSVDTKSCSCNKGLHQTCAWHLIRPSLPMSLTQSARSRRCRQKLMQLNELQGRPPNIRSTWLTKSAVPHRRPILWKLCKIIVDKGIEVGIIERNCIP